MSFGYRSAAQRWRFEDEPTEQSPRMKRLLAWLDSCDDWGRGDARCRIMESESVSSRRGVRSCAVLTPNTRRDVLRDAAYPFWSPSAGGPSMPSTRCAGSALPR